jgi:hypothetical protein
MIHPKSLSGGLLTNITPPGEGSFPEKFVTAWWYFLVMDLAGICPPFFYDKSKPGRVVY